MTKNRFAAIEERLERWARWYGDSNRAPTGGYHNPLAALHGEGVEMDRGGRAKKASLDTISKVRDSLKARIKAAEANNDADAAGRLRRLLRRFPSTPAALPWASLIHGVGMRPDPDCPEQEETELAIAALMPTLRKVVHAEFLRYGPLPEKAKGLGYAIETYQRRLNEAITELNRRLT